MRHRKLIFMTLSLIVIFLIFFQDITSHRKDPKLASQIITYLNLRSHPSIYASPYAQVIDPEYLSNTHIVQAGLTTHLFANIAEFFIGSEPSGFVIANTIFINNSEPLEYQIPLLAHELVHIEQIKQRSYPIFLFQYFGEFKNSGYSNISFESEAYEFQTKIISAILDLKPNP